MITTCLHTHTTRCGHARGTDREYIESAIAAGYREIGFSEHIPLANPKGEESGFRVPTALTEDYFSCLRALREEYRDRITIHIGFEMEYYAPRFEEMLDFAREHGSEYLILGQHFTGCEYDGDVLYMGHAFSDENALKAYVKAAVAGMERGVFTYLAHPDVANFTGNMHVYDDLMRGMVRDLKAMDCVLEVNRNGYATNRHYPNERFWRMAAEEEARVVIGLDAHSNDVFTDRKTSDALENYVRALGITFEESKPIFLK